MDETDQRWLDQLLLLGRLVPGAFDLGEAGFLARLDRDRKRRLIRADEEELYRLVCKHLRAVTPGRMGVPT